MFGGCCYNINCVVLIVEEFDFKSTTVMRIRE